MTVASSRNVKRRIVKRRPIVKQLIRPGYCSIKNLERLILFVELMHVQVGVKITAKILLEVEDESLKIPESEVYLVRAAAHYLHLLDDQYCVTERLIELAHATEDQYRIILKEVTEQSYKSVLDDIHDLAHAPQQEFRDAFLKNGYYEPTTLQKMVALFKNLSLKSGMIISENETPDANVLKEQVSEIDPITGQEIFTSDNVEVVKGSQLMIEPPSNSLMNGFLPAPDYSEAEEVGKFMMSLFELPKKPGWTEEDRTWWRQAVSLKAEKIAQLTKEHGGIKP